MRVTAPHGYGDLIATRIRRACARCDKGPEAVGDQGLVDDGRAVKGAGERRVEVAGGDNGSRVEAHDSLVAAARQGAWEEVVGEGEDDEVAGLCLPASVAANDGEALASGEARPLKVVCALGEKGLRVCGRRCGGGRGC